MFLNGRDRRMGGKEGGASGLQTSFKNRLAPVSYQGFTTGMLGNCFNLWIFIPTKLKISIQL